MQSESSPSMADEAKLSRRGVAGDDCLPMQQSVESCTERNTLSLVQVVLILNWELEALKTLNDITLSK